MFTTETDISAESLYRHKHINENNDNSDNGNNDKDFCIELYIDTLFDHCIQLYLKI